MCAFISSDLAPGARVYIKGPAGHNLGEGDCMLKCIYGLVQSPRDYCMLCREIYQKAGLKQLQSDECVLIRYVSKRAHQRGSAYQRRIFQHGCNA